MPPAVFFSIRPYNLPSPDSKYHPTPDPSQKAIFPMVLSVSSFITVGINCAGISPDFQISKYTLKKLCHIILFSRCAQSLPPAGLSECTTKNPADNPAGLNFSLFRS